jgi:hypothetical protein
VTQLLHKAAVVEAAPRNITAVPFCGVLDWSILAIFVQSIAMDLQQLMLQQQQQQVVVVVMRMHTGARLAWLSLAQT